MNVLPVCVLYTQDAALARRVSGFLYSLALVRHIDSTGKLQAFIQQYDPTLLLFDLRGKEYRSLLPQIMNDFPDSLVVAFGLPRSDPAKEAESMGVYAIEDLNFTRHSLQTLVARCHAHLSLVKENRVLRMGRQATVTQPALGEPQCAPVADSGREMLMPMPLHHFSRAIRNFDDLDAMLESIVEGVSSYARVSRVGLFSIEDGGDAYHLKAGTKCLEGTADLEVPEGSPLVRWMQMHAHLVSRVTLNHIADAAERMLLEQSLDTLGAEAIIPLHGRSSLAGWLFIGRRITGVPFRSQELEQLMLLAEYVSITLENARLHKEVAVQKTLAETVLHSIPAGIVAIADDGTVRWFNEAAEKILGVSAADAMNRPAGNMASRLAGLLAQCLKGSPTEDPIEWMDPVTKRSLSVETRQLQESNQCLGAVAIIIDMTREERLRQKQNEIERAAFWAELAAAMSHAVRNPLVAISTFAQLLPERYADEEFRTRFSQLVSREIGRLDVMIDQLSDFAHPPPLDFRASELDQIIEKGVERALQRNPHSKARIDLDLDSSVPAILGDRDALTEAVTHLVCNAIEAVERAPHPAIKVGATATRDKDKTVCVLSVQDCGSGVPSNILKNVFSPFCTEKVRGIGLGLPIVRRIVQDHSGTLDIETGKKGTTVSIQLAAAPPEEAQGSAHQPTRSHPRAFAPHA